MIRLSPLLAAAVATLSVACSSNENGQPPRRPQSQTSLAPVETLYGAHIAGTNLPQWAACWFPHRANPYARRRAEPCPAETKATRTYRMRELLGCWRLLQRDGRPLALTTFAAPVRLLPGPSDKQRRWGWDTDGMRGVQPLGPVADSLAMDTALVVTYWTFAPPDSLKIASTTGFAGPVLSFRVRGDSLVGMLQWSGDVVRMSVDTGSDSVVPLAGHRSQCAPAA